MDNVLAKAGDIVVTNFNGYQHWSIVSDKKCSNGKQMLISATKRTRTVKEEPWDDVTQGNKTYVAKVFYERPINECLALARREIDNWKYDILGHNCEHFVRWATGLTVSSQQVKAGVMGAVLGATTVKLCSEKPTLLKYLTGGLVFGGLAVWCSRADIK